MAVLILIQFLIGLSLVRRALLLFQAPYASMSCLTSGIQIVAASRQVFAFSRDYALPFSPILRKITSLNGQPQPINAIVFLGGICVIFGLLALINSVAANALFSLFVASNYVAWGTPILCRLVWSKRFVPGVFYTGPKVSGIIASIAVAWLGFGLLLSMFPTVKNPGRKCRSISFLSSVTGLRSMMLMDLGLDTAAEMNYTVVINGFVWIASMLYYAVYARKVFTGPRVTLAEGEGVSSSFIGTQAEAEREVNNEKEVGTDTSPAGGWDTAQQQTVKKETEAV